MEKGLNSRNSITKITKTQKRGHASKSSLDETALKHYEGHFQSSMSNLRSSLQNSLSRNSYKGCKSPFKSQDVDYMKVKLKKMSSNNKKPNLKDLITGHQRYPGSCFTSTVTPNNKSKCGSVVNLDEIQTSSEISKFKFIYQIGFGGFGKVWKVLKKKTCKQFAMKEISKRKVIEKDNVQSIMNERYILSSLSHSFLINIHSSFQDEFNLYLTMDYLRGADLRYHICYKEKFSEAEISIFQFIKEFIIACLIVGLEYVHEKGIIHRDIKPENIVFEETGYARLTDFGIAKVQSSRNLPLKFQSSGTPGYMAPEILCKMPYTFSSDFFAIGVIVYELMMGKRPYDGANRKEIRQNIITHQALLKEQQLPKGMNKSVLSFVNGLLQRNPEERLGHQGFNQIKSHKWLKDINWKLLQRKQIVPPFKPHVVCETKEYLDEIVLYNQMKTNDQNSEATISSFDQQKFQNYDFKKVERQKIRTQKQKIPNFQIPQNSIKPKNLLSRNGSQANLSSMLVKPSPVTNNFFKKNRRNSQERMLH